MATRETPREGFPAALLRVQELYEDYAATTIQAAVRGYFAWRWLRRLRKATKRIQIWWRFWSTRAHLRNAACIKLQNAWRSHSYKRIYQQRKRIINFRQQGHPQELLRCINAHESQYLDAAAGVHVRFRLGGVRFPPAILYKVFTHRPVADMCAFGPRDYASEAVQVKSGAISRQRGLLDSAEPAGPYRRIENNDWRPVAPGVLAHETCASEQSKSISHVALVRRQDRLQHLKNRKRKWLQEMYRAKHQEVAATEAICSPELASMTLPANMDPDDMLADLLDWTQALDFDAYLNIRHALDLHSPQPYKCNNKLLGLPAAGSGLG